MSFVSRSLHAPLKMNTTTTMATPMEYLELVFHKLSEKVTFLTFIKRNNVFDFDWWFLVKFLKTMNHNHGFHGNQVFSQGSILDKLSEKLFE